MYTLSITSQKGGSGKTTLSIHLAAAAAKDGKNTVLIDLDPQASSSSWFDRRKENQPVVISTHAKRLRFELDHIAKNQGDLVILDTAPHSDQIALEAMRHADLVVIPSRPSILDIDAISSTIELSHIAGKDALVVMNACLVRGKEAEDAATAITALKTKVCPVRVSQRAIFARSLLLGKTAAEVEPRGKAAQELHSLYTYISRKLESIGEQ